MGTDFMGFGDIPLLSILQQKMGWLNDRQSVLSRNIANASTPGFVPMDLNKKDFASAVSDAMRDDLLTTNPLHLRSKASVGGSFRAIATPDSQSSPDGNAVVVEEQMMKVAETQMAYAEAAGLYKKMFSMWRTALGHG
jgi:flagellar basal-body rod protein FlgB